MRKSEFAAGWERLRSIYGTLPKLDATIGNEWFRVLQRFSAEDYNNAISAWIAEQKYKPVPSELAKYCRTAHSRRRSSKLAAAKRSGDICPWCGNFGYIRKVLEPQNPDVYFACRCVASPDPEAGTAILAAATADAGWEFDPLDHAFRRRRAWIGGEDKPATAPADQQVVFRQMAAQVGQTL